MPETIRQYAREKLLELGDAGTTRRRHLEFCLQLAEPSEGNVSSAEPITLNQLEREHDNLRAALAWSLDETSGVADDGLRLQYVGTGRWWRDLLDA